MDSTQVSHREDAAFGAHLSVHKMPAHWLMARLGKRVLRPGGLRMTRWLLEHAGVVRSDDVIEFAPGLGLTAREILRRKPNSYAGVERDAEATEFARRALARAGFPGTRILYGDAAQVPLPDGSATVVLGEAMLSMQPPEKKRAIIAEAHRLLRAGGRFAMHELAVAPEDIDRTRLELIQSDLSKSTSSSASALERWRSGNSGSRRSASRSIRSPRRRCTCSSPAGSFATKVCWAQHGLCATYSECRAPRNDSGKSGTPSERTSNTFAP